MTSATLLHPEENNFAKNLAIVAGTTAVAGTAIYLSTRESNDVKIERAQDWITYYSGNLYGNLAEIATISDLQQFVNQSLKFKKEMSVFCKGVHCSYAEIKSRYSWLKPWNWTSKMKATYNQITELNGVARMIEMMFTYQPFIMAYHSNFDESTIVKKTQEVCHGTSSYPMMHCVTMIHNDLRFLQKAYFKISCDIVLIDLLEKMLNLIVDSTTYIEERRIKEEIAFKERQTRAQEAQVAAQMAQARAQADQAKAQQERNRIETEKLKHKKTSQ